MKIVHVSTVGDALEFLDGQCAFMASSGADVTVISAPGEVLHAFARREGARAIEVPMSRAITPVADLRAVATLTRIFRRLAPDVVHAHTPKAGLVAVLAARLARVPVVIYQVHGLRYMTATGPARTLLKATEKVATTLAHSVLCVSRSCAQAGIDDGVLDAAKVRVLGDGTVNGVGTGRIRGADPARVAELAARLGAAPPVIGFVGRVVKDKGIEDLAAAWRLVADRVPAAHLLIVGDEEPFDPISPAARAALTADGRVHRVPYTDDIAPLYALMTLLVLPSHREGFGQVLLEAAACALPTVGSDIPGIRDAIVDGETGVLVPAHDADALAAAILRLLADPAHMERLGAAGCRRVEEKFRPERLWHLTLEHYRALLGAARPAEASHAAR